jgi:hypothetical protein
MMELIEVPKLMEVPDAMLLEVVDAVRAGDSRTS